MSNDIRAALERLVWLNEQRTTSFGWADAFTAARAALAAAPEGEVGELIQCLRIRAASLGAEGASLGQRGDACYFTRAAALLSQLSAAAPAVVPDGPAVPFAGREPASVTPEATGLRPLSPAAQAVLDAAVLPCTIREGIAAALRAAADQVVPEAPMIVPGGRSYEGAWSATVQDAIRRQLLAIAAELEGIDA